jgi:hypothetical protein
MLGISKMTKEREGETMGMYRESPLVDGDNVIVTAGSEDAMD